MFFMLGSSKGGTKNKGRKKQRMQQSSLTFMAAPNPLSASDWMEKPDFLAASAAKVVEEEEEEDGAANNLLSRRT